LTTSIAGAPGVAVGESDGAGAGEAGVGELAAVLAGADDGGVLLRAACTAPPQPARATVSNRVRLLGPLRGLRSPTLDSLALVTASSHKDTSPSSAHNADLALALELADAADAITQDRFLALDLQVQTKPDTTPVSDADLAVEALLREKLSVARPGDTVLGEEQGEITGSGGQAAGRRWILDPIDGTKNYVRGVPVWATLLALEIDGVIAVGVVSAPALGRRWWASRGAGAYADGRRIGVSKVTAIDDASLSYSSHDGWAKLGRLEGFLQLTRTVWRDRAFGDFWSHCLVAEGAVDISAEPEVSLWDVAPLKVIVEEAGGTFTDLTGDGSPAAGSIVCTNGPLHAPVLEMLEAR
jgi:histidinol-phosphatase